MDIRRATEGAPHPPALTDSMTPLRDIRAPSPLDGPSGDSAIRNGRRFINAVVGVTLGLQILVEVVPLLPDAIHPHIPAEDRTFPFQNYPMYAEYHAAGDHVVVEFVAFARLTTGEEVRITEQDVMPEIPSSAKAIAFWMFHNHFTQSIFWEDQAKLARFLKPYEQRTGRRIVALRVENNPVGLSRSGPTQIAAETLKVLRLTAPTESVKR